MDIYFSQIPCGQPTFYIGAHAIPSGDSQFVLSSYPRTFEIYSSLDELLSSLSKYISSLPSYVIFSYIDSTWYFTRHLDSKYDLNFLS